MDFGNGILLSEKPNRRYQFGDLDVDERIYIYENGSYTKRI
jgi:hypothetical protein